MHNTAPTSPIWISVFFSEVKPCFNETCIWRVVRSWLRKDWRFIIIWYWLLYRYLWQMDRTSPEVCLHRVRLCGATSCMLCATGCRQWLCAFGTFDHSFFNSIKFWNVLKSYDTWTMCIYLSVPTHFVCLYQHILFDFKHSYSCSADDFIPFY